MKFNFKKITSVLTSVVMIGSTIGIAAAASTYPAPFVKGGVADVAVVVGASAASSDYLAAVDVGQSLQAELAKQTATTTTTTATVSGEASALYTEGTKLYINDSLNAVKNVLTKSELPTVLADGTFSGDVDATYTSTIDLGSNPVLIYAKQPTTATDPVFGYSLSTNTASYIYNASVTFNKAVNFSTADSKNQELKLFGKKFTVGAGTDTASLILFKESTTLNLDSSGVTSSEVTIGGKKYTVELVSASTTTATIKVTNEAGTTEQKEVTEGYSKKINGVTVAVQTADTNNLKYTASVVAGAEKFTLTTGSTITYGDSDVSLDGTKVTFPITNRPLTNLTKIVISYSAKDSDNDALLPGGTFLDPMFGTFKIDFSGLNIPDNSTARETIKAYASGDNKLFLTMTDYSSGTEKTIQYAYNDSIISPAIGSFNGTGYHLELDDQGHNIVTAEMAYANRSDYIVVGNEDEGKLIKVSTITNQSTSYTNDAVKFSDVFSGDTYTATLTSEGSGSVTIAGKVYTVTYSGPSTAADEDRQVRLNYPDSTNDMIIYPTIQTKLGAKVIFYEPLTINLTNWDNGGTALTGNNIKVPNGADSYQNIAVLTTNGDGNGNFTIDGTNVNASSFAKVTITNTGLSLLFTWAGKNTTTVYAIDPSVAATAALNMTNINVSTPGIIILEEKDDNNLYEGAIIASSGGGVSSNGYTVDGAARLWSNDSQWNTISLASDSKKTKEADLWGTIYTVDGSDSDQKIVTISYPDSQVFAQIYGAANTAEITAGTTSGGTGVTILGSVTVRDSELGATDKAKNLIVVGGSCINSVAASILGGVKCSADFTTATGVGTDQFLVKVVTSPYATDKVAMLVAGYEAADTTKAVKYVTKELNVPTDVGTNLKKVTSTYADVA